MSFDEMKHKYLHDPLFHSIVDSLYKVLYDGKLNVSDLRDAAVFAGYKFESENIKPFFMRY